MAPPPEGNQPDENADYRPPSKREERPVLSETVRVSTLKLDSLLRQAEELLSAKLTGAHRISELREINQILAQSEKARAKLRPLARALRQSLERDKKEKGGICSPDPHKKTISQIAGVLAFLEQQDSSRQLLMSRLVSLAKLSEQDHRTFGRQVDDLLEDAKKVSMLPCSSLLEAIPKLVRDLSRDCGKDVELATRGVEIEIDKRILEEMKDPLIHLVRNCIDHGIEDPKARERKQKPARATITIAISLKNSDKVEILVSDDGTGIDVEKVRTTALKHNLVPPDEGRMMSDRDALALVFKSGLSTSPMITEVSGRGLGLAIVRERAEKLGGAVSVETHPGAGTTFRIDLPLTLATFRGLLVSVDDHLFILPTLHVERALRVVKDEIKSVENRQTILFGGKAVSFVRLADVLEFAGKSMITTPAAKAQVVVLRWGGQCVAFLVDEILAEQEVLVKSLGAQLSRVRNVAGATVLGTGKVIPVLNVSDLMQSALIAVPAAISTGETQEAPQSVLVAEDSITARTLLKSILQSAGYKVRTAVDGADALAVLKTEEFDLVVSDVEMPRMSGFELTARIRADPGLSELPVVLVTALASREDRERGIDAGANAYIVKSSFDQSNLLDAVRRLI